MAEAENIGYKRYKKNKVVAEKFQPNELYRVASDGKVLVDDGENSSILDCLRTVHWE